MGDGTDVKKSPMPKLAKTKASLTLANNQKKYLRGLGHSLNPLLQVGKEGVSAGFISQLKVVLLDHELVKVKILQNSPMSKEEVETALMDKAGAILVQRIGKTFLLYAPHPEEPVIKLPRARKKPAVTS